MVWSDKGRFAASVFALVSFSVPCSQAANDGLALTPPMGWRSWNTFGGAVSDILMRETATALTVKRNSSTGAALSDDDGSGVSLADLGYDDCGLDDNWQSCGAGISGSFHDAQGRPIVNKERFPDMAGMVDYIHSVGLKAGFYHNNCICREKQKETWEGDAHYHGDVEATLDFGFDSVKLDRCGEFNDLDKWYALFSDSTRKSNRSNVMIENCHWGLEVPTAEHCPYHMFRTSNDINGHWVSMWINLQSTRKFQDKEKPISRPGCWAYPDMLEVGRLASPKEDRSHFGAWVITSSPLILGHDVRDDSLNQRLWPIIANKWALDINQDWAGHPGRLVKASGGLQVWAKPLSGGSFAVFVISNVLWSKDTSLSERRRKDSKTRIVVDFSTLGAAAGKEYGVRDVWNGMEPVVPDLVQNEQLIVELETRDSSLLRFDLVGSDHWSVLQQE